MFSGAMSNMYRKEVPQYGTLCNLVAEINAMVRSDDANGVAAASRDVLEHHRIEIERHGAVRVGTSRELAILRRLFRVMGLAPVGYYDLSAAGVPVHSTAFRPVDQGSLDINPFRVFTSLLRLELIEDASLRRKAEQILAKREIFTPGCLEAISLAEKQGGLDQAQARKFVSEAIETFRWHGDATVDIKTYLELRNAHALVADIVCFKGPHINHLTPRTLDIDAIQREMLVAGIRAKEVIEGPPPRTIPILLRQTSFLALEEPIRFVGETKVSGTHTARFGEVEQRGCALTQKGRALYDELLRESSSQTGDQATSMDIFRRFPDDLATLYRERLVFVHYEVNENKLRAHPTLEHASVDDLVEGGWLNLKLQTYEDFLPVSAAGIFRSNLGEAARDGYTQAGCKESLEQALGEPILDELALYSASQDESLCAALSHLRGEAATTRAEASLCVTTS
jgi:uncharacterized glyoxalase superfamily metalloenzyme YdcJ